MPSKNQDIENQANEEPGGADHSLALRYDQMVAGGTIHNDDTQRVILDALQALSHQLNRHAAAPPRPRLLHRILGRKGAAAAPPGIYIWGNVGRGKSMLMDLFFENAPVTRKRRVHFHAFMQEVHQRIHQLRSQPGYRGDPVAQLARDIAHETRLLCFDELQATDPADASLLHRLFSGLFDHHAVIVSTSNHPPASLYTGGVQRERFAKFIALIEDKMQVLALSSSSDYRMTQIKSLRKLYFYPLGKEANRFIDDIIASVAADDKPQQGTLSVHGRTTRFTLYGQSIGRFTFAELCQKNLGAADYLALARRLDTVIITGIPELSPEQRNEAKRFVTLIDALYEHKVRLICTASVPPEGLYKGGDGSFEFRRTASRLAEMQSAQYLKDDATHHEH
jgi:cell division protein ZapE